MTNLEALAEKVHQLEKRMDQSDRYRHEMRAQIMSFVQEQAVIHSELKDLRVDVQDLGDKMDVSSSHRFTTGLTMFAAVVGPMVGGAIALILQGH